MFRMTFLLLCLVWFGTCQHDMMDISIREPRNQPDINPLHPLADSLQALVDQHVAGGLPGAYVAVLNADGLWIGTGGYAKLETREPMHVEQDFLIHSLTKTYFATLALRLQEQGRLDLDKTIDQYLPEPISSRLPATDRITVRMLLNHTSGLPNFSDILSYQTEIWMNGTRRRDREDILEHVYGHDLNFEPGSEYRYSNTNYLLLTFIIETVTGKDHAVVLREELLAPLNLTHTYYKDSETYLDDLALPNYYADRFGNGRLENMTLVDVATEGYSSRGEGGMAAAPEDVLRFLTALAEGQILSPPSWQEMTEWVTGPGSSEPDYGLGLVYWNIGGGPAEFGHSGGGVAGQAFMMYFPGNRTAVFIGLNTSQFFGGPYSWKVADFRNQVYEYLARQQ